MPRVAEVHADPNEFVRALRDPGRNLKEKFRNDPIGLAKRFGIKLPPKPVDRMIEAGVLTEEEAVERFGKRYPGLRDLVEDVCSLEVTDAVAVANRGGGKSYGVSFIEFFLWMVLDFDALNLGGSELQADNVYQYLLGYLESDPFWMTLVKGDTQKEKTYTTTDSWVRVLTASQKSVRSPHAGGERKGRIRGGVLVIDEEAEAEPEIVKAALPTINTARPSVNVRCSTFHKIGGSFQDVVDNHEEMGYKLYRWDIFDVCSGCDCVGECQSEEVCFREDHYEDYINPDTEEVERKLLHRAYCGGRAMYAQGWIPIEEIAKMWKRGKRNHSSWEVEAMGSRPASSGQVIKDLNTLASNITTESAASKFVPGSPVTINVDWGTGVAAISAVQEQPGDRHVVLHAEQVPDNSDTQIVGMIVGLANTYRKVLKEIRADIGGGGNYLNPKLRDEYRLPVTDVVFGDVKETAVAAMNIYNDAGKYEIPEEFDDLIGQLRGWRRKNGRIMKGDDHLADTMVCYFSQFIDRLGIRKVAIPPRSFRTGQESNLTAPPKPSFDRPSAKSGPRVAVVRSLGGAKRRR